MLKHFKCTFHGKRSNHEGWLFVYSTVEWSWDKDYIYNIAPRGNDGFLVGNGQMARWHSVLPLGPIYAILGTEMAIIRPSWVGSGNGLSRKMRIHPEYNFGLLDQMARWHSFWALAQFMHFWQLKWPPFGHFGLDLDKVGVIWCGFLHCIILYYDPNGQDQ